MANITVSSPVDSFMQSANEAQMRDRIGLGTMSTQDANAVAITGGSVTGLTSLDVSDNTTLGTSHGDTVEFNARIASQLTPATDDTHDLGRPGHAWRNLNIAGTANIDSLVADTADIDGGTIDGASIGATTPSTGAFTSVDATTTANDAGAVALQLQNADSNAGIGSRLAWRLDDLANEWGYINVNRVGGGATAQMDFGINGAAYSGAASVGMSLTSNALAITGVLGVTQQDAAYTYIRGATKAVRFRASPSSTFIEGVDNTITSSYEPLAIGGSTLDFQIQASTKMVIDSNGLVGIGTASPTEKLTVSGAVVASGALSANGTSVSAVDHFSNAMRYFSYGESGVVGSHFWYVGSGGAAPTSPMSLTSTGLNSTAIGATTPSTGAFTSLNVVRTGAVNNININDASGNLGATLSFLGSTSGTGNNWQIGNQIQQSDTLTFTPSTATGGSTFTTPTLTLTGAGRVGIGTTAPAQLFTVSGATADFVGLITNSTSSGNGLKINAGDNSGDRVLELNDKDGTFLMKVTGQGKVGIGTASPARALTVAATEAVASLIEGTSASGTFLDFGNSNYHAGSLARVGIDGSGDMQVGAPGAGGDLQLLTASSTRLTILNTNGNVGIGLTSPAYQIQLSTDSAAKPSTNTWTIASDARIKTETGEYTKGLDAVLSLRPVTYRYNGKAGMVDDGEDKISIIAQEAVNAFPECVGSYMTMLNEDDDEETEVLNWNGHALTFALVNSIKELTARLEALENN